MRKFKEKFIPAILFIQKYKAITIILAIIMVVSIVSIVSVCGRKNMIDKNESKISADCSEIPVSDSEQVLIDSEPELISTEEKSEAVTTESVAEKPQKTAAKQETYVPEVIEKKQYVGTDYKYNSNMNVNDNVFLDALVYTGYNIQAQRNSGLMWASGNSYVLCSRKRGLGWLSGITYGGGCTGYETDANGRPNIKRFEKGGLVCASYVTYVYFNYLPNVAGIDTSVLTRPERSYDANSWYIAANSWVNSGYSRYIDFKANDGGSINRDISFSSAEEIPIGSIICLEDWYKRDGHCSHVSIYAGFSGGYHWVTHVGNANGPEFCAIERMNRKPDPQWPLKIITPPSNIRFSASVEVLVVDGYGNPNKGAGIKLENISNGKVTELGITDENGRIAGDGYTYGGYRIIQTVPDGYTCENSVAEVNFTTGNNSMNTVKFINNLVVPDEDIEQENSDISESSENTETDEKNCDS